MSKDKLSSILDKQKLIDGLVKKQSNPNSQRAETVVVRQHEAELMNYIHSSNTHDLAIDLDSLTLELARWVWSKVPSIKQNEILWELSDERRLYLAPNHEPEFTVGKLSMFELADGRLKQLQITKRSDLENTKPIWIDLLRTSKAERTYIEAFMKSKKALLMKQSDDKSAAGQERDAYASDEYQSLLLGLRVAVEEEEKLKWLISGAEIQIDIWRTESSNNRAMTKL